VNIFAETHCDLPKSDAIMSGGIDFFAMTCRSICNYRGKSMLRKFMDAELVYEL
jgi:hypothetical protein